MASKLHVSLLSMLAFYVLLALSFPVVSQNAVAAVNTSAGVNEQKINKLCNRIQIVEQKQNTDIAEQKERVDRVLSISEYMLTYVGLFSSILLALILFLLGFQIYKANQSDKHIDKILKQVDTEYKQIVALHAEADKIIKDVKEKTKDLGSILSTLAMNYIETSPAMAEIKQKVSQTVAEIKNTHESEIQKSKDLMKKLELLDLTLTPQIYVERGNIYQKQGDLQKAIENYTKAINMDQAIARLISTVELRITTCLNMTRQYLTMRNLQRTVHIIFSLL